MNVVVTQSGKKVNIADIVLPDDVVRTIVSMIG
nr:MAG TPA: alpha GA-binding protein alpha chain [Bacteriophage sp.]